MNHPNRHLLLNLRRICAYRYFMYSRTSHTSTTQHPVNLKFHQHQLTISCKLLHALCVCEKIKLN
jgi:hypothetical protein